MPGDACMKCKDKKRKLTQHSHNAIKYKITYGNKGEEKFIRVFHIVKKLILLINDVTARLTVCCITSVLFYPPGVKFFIDHEE